MLTMTLQLTINSQHWIITRCQVSKVTMCIIPLPHKHNSHHNKHSTHSEMLQANQHNKNSKKLAFNLTLWEIKQDFSHNQWVWITWEWVVKWEARWEVRWVVWEWVKWVRVKWVRAKWVVEWVWEAKWEEWIHLAVLVVWECNSNNNSQWVAWEWVWEVEWTREWIVAWEVVYLIHRNMAINKLQQCHHSFRIRGKLITQDSVISKTAKLQAMCLLEVW